LFNDLLKINVKLASANNQITFKMDEFIIGLSTTIAGSLLNFTATKIYNRFSGSQKNFFWYENRIDLNTFNFNSEFQEQKGRTRIVVIDDENSFPVELFTNGVATFDWSNLFVLLNSKQ
jgi:hypothetical protein